MQIKLLIFLNICSFVIIAPSLLMYLPQSHYPQKAASSSHAAPPSLCATHCHSVSRLPVVPLVPYLRGGKASSDNHTKSTWCTFSTQICQHKTHSLLTGPYIHSFTESLKDTGNNIYLKPIQLSAFTHYTCKGKM